MGVFMKFFMYVLSVCVIVLCAQIARRQPRLGGLIAVMPLTGLAALVWLYVKDPSDLEALTGFTNAAIWGILPSILFFVAAFFCFRRHMPLWKVLCASFSVWLVAACVHQWLLKK